MPVPALPEAPLGLPLELDEHRAHLQADAARLEEGQPRVTERAWFSVVDLAVRELEQQVDVGVSDHDGIITSRPPSCSFSPLIDKAPSTV